MPLTSRGGGPHAKEGHAGEDSRGKLYQAGCSQSQEVSYIQVKVIRKHYRDECDVGLYTMS